jgi:hypothetical protein
LQPRADYRSCTLTLAWHEDTFYTDLWAQRPTPLYTNPRRFETRSLPYPWQPYASQPIPDDSMFDEEEWEFDPAQTYEDAADGTAIARLVIYGCPPVNQPSTIQPPFVKAQGNTSPTGGFFGAGDYVIRICALDADGVPSPMSAPIKVSVPVGTDTNTISTGDITWQDGAVGYIVFAGIGEDRLAFQDRNDGALPSGVTLTVFQISTYGPPDILFDHLVIRAKKILHAGVWGPIPVDVVDTGTLQFLGAAWDVDQWTDYDISLVSLATSSSPFGRENFRVVSNDADTLTVFPDPVENNILTGFIFVMRSKGATFTDTTIDDPLWVNFFSVGLVPDAEVGNTVRVISGNGRGQLRTITGNTATEVTVSPAWTTPLDATSRVIIEESVWQDSPDVEKVSSTVPNPSPVPIVARPIVSNYAGQMLLVQVLTSDANDNWSLEPFSPLREIYIFGGPGTLAEMVIAYA